MKLTTQQSYELLAKFGSYIREVCDKCGKGIGAVCFTRKDEYGVWCSREYRDGAAAHEPRTCKHCKARLPKGKRKGASYCDDACKQAAHRETVTELKLSVTKTSIYAAFCSIPSPPCYGDSQTPQNGLNRNKNTLTDEVAG